MHAWADQSIVRKFPADHLWSAALGRGRRRISTPGFDRFEPVLHYDDALSYRMLDSASARLGKPPETLLEDFGTFLVAAPGDQAGPAAACASAGVDYEDFLASLEDLRGRARLAVPDLDLPQIELDRRGRGLYRLACRSPHQRVRPGLPRPSARARRRLWRPCADRVRRRGGWCRDPDHPPCGHRFRRGPCVRHRRPGRAIGGRTWQP
jgi:hypothetical protein